MGWEDCEVCGGTGGMVGTPGKSGVGSAVVTNHPCPDCKGIGQIPDPETVEAKATELHKSRCAPGCYMPPDESWRHYARTVLVAARWGQEPEA